MTDGYFHNRNNAGRYMVVKVDDSGTENYVDLDGMTGHKPTKVLHIQPHGFSSVPVKDAHLVTIPVGHHHDSHLALGGESGAHKPKSLGDGNTALYNADGTIWKLVKKNAMLTASGTVEISAPTIVFNCGNVVVTINSAGLQVKGAHVLAPAYDIGQGPPAPSL